MIKIVVALLLISSLLNCKAQKFLLNSPDNKLAAEIEIDQSIRVKIVKNGESVVNLEGLSLELAAKLKQLSKLRVIKTARTSANEEIQPFIHEKSKTYRNLYNELSIGLNLNMGLTFRLFNEGFAYRISSSIKDSLTIRKENLKIQFQEGDSVRFQQSPTFSSAYETPYEFKKISELENKNLCNLPILIQKKNGTFVMFTESDLYNFPGLWVNGTGSNELIAVNPHYPKNLLTDGNVYSHGQVTGIADYIAKVKGTRTFPWRLFAITDHEDGLISNNMVYLLASPTELKDVSWIKPGVVMFDWWGKNNIYGVDFKAGINTETAKYYIDFCAAHGFRYFLFDDGWCPKEDLLHEVKGLNLVEVTAYARGKGVDIMLWVMWNGLKKQWTEAFDQFQKWGIKGIKMDFMNRDDQQMVEFYEAVAGKCAEMKMVVDFHGAYKPCGLSRKYPNVLTREALIEFEYNGGNSWDNPTHHNLLPYIRMFTGPMDYIPATMRNSTSGNFRPVGDYPMGQGTRAHAMALFVILSSPMEMLPDSPSDYYREKECTQFLSKIPVQWDETLLLRGKISKFTVLARRSGDDWYVSAITNEQERTLELRTDFLKQGKYRVEAIQDGINATARAEDYKKIERIITAGDSIKINMAPGGGWIARIMPAN